MANKVVLELDIDESGAVRGIKRIEKEVDELQDKSSKIGKGKGGGLEFLETISPRAASAVKGLTGNISGLAGGFKTLRAAIISTGIGALVVVLGSLVAYFTQTKRGAELLERATAGLGAVMGVITDAASALGEMIVNAFRNPEEAINALQTGLNSVGLYLETLGTFIKTTFKRDVLTVQKLFYQAAIAAKEFFGGDASELKESLSEVEAELDDVIEEQINGLKKLASPFKAIAKGIKNIKDEIVEETTAADRLTKASQRLRDTERELAVERAKRRADIKEFNKIAEDTTRSYDERARAAQQAAAIEEELLQKRLNAAAENVRIIREQNAMSESTEEDLQRLADAEIELAGIREESLELQTTIQNKLNTIRQQQEMERLAEQKRIAEEEKRIAEEVEKVREYLVKQRGVTEEEEVNAKFEKLREQANGETELLKELEMQRQYELGQIRQEAAMKEYEKEKEKNRKIAEDKKTLEDAKISFAKNTAGTLIGIAELISGNSEKNAKKLFAVNKALSIAEGIQNTYAGVTAVLKDTSLPTAAKPFAIGSVIATGLLNVAKIAATKFGGTSAGASGGGRGGGGFTANATQGTPQPTAAIDFGFQDNRQEPIRSYIIGSDVQDDMEARTRVQDRTSL